MDGIDPLLLAAIRDRRRLRFRYNGRPRLVEPQCYGLGTRGTQLLRAHQLEGGEQAEPLFDVARIEALELLDATFDHPGPHYRRGDSAMASIFAEL